MNKSLVTNKQAWLVALYDLSMALLAWGVVHFLVFDHVSAFSLSQFLFISLSFSIAIKYFRTYAALWKTISVPDLMKNIKAVVVGMILFLSLEFFTSRLHDIARSEVIFYPVLTLMLMLAGRFFYRQYLFKFNSSRGKKLLIIGAGDGASLFLRENDNLPSPYNILACLDDDNSLHGKLLRNTPIIGSIGLLTNNSLRTRYPFEEILIAIPSLDRQASQRIVAQCKSLNLPVKILPSLLELVEGAVLTDLREVELSDLLGREQVEINWDKISNIIDRKNVVVTGGGGSIGSELCRQIARLNPTKLLIIDNSEFNLYQIEHELRTQFPTVHIKISLCSVLDKDAIARLFENFSPDIVFHAAAYKHVPMLEDQIRIAVRNNILGTRVVAEASVANNVRKFVLISTDKAVNPTNIMGTTKRIAEIYCQNFNQYAATEFITVRFGNVLGSAGSVVPLFKKQLKHGGPLTVTHPDISRYFMTIPEASRLILQAMANGQGGEIFVLDMGKPIKISYLAEQLIRLSGKEPNKDIAIEYTGLRPGEKLFEELFHESEQLELTEHDKILKAKHRQVDWHYLTGTMNDYELQCKDSNDGELLNLLIKLVPEYAGNYVEKPISIAS